MNMSNMSVEYILRYKQIDAAKGAYTTITDEGDIGSISWLGIQWKWLKSWVSFGYWGTKALDRETLKIIKIANDIFNGKEDGEIANSEVVHSLLNLKKINKREGGNHTQAIDACIAKITANTFKTSQLRGQKGVIEFLNGIDKALGKSYDGNPCKGNLRAAGDEKFRTIYSEAVLQRIWIADPEVPETFKELKITKQQLIDIRQQFAKALGKNQFGEITLAEKHLLVVIIMYQDVFKVREMMQLIYPNDPNKWTIQNHDKALYEACAILLTPDYKLDANGLARKKAIAEALPELAKLPSEDIELVLKMWGLGVSVPQLVQGEASLESANGFVASEPHQISSGAKVNVLQLFRLVDWLDVAGAACQAPEGWGLPKDATMEQWLKQADSGERGKSQLPMLSILYHPFTMMRRAIDKAGKGSSVYQTFIDMRAEQYGIKSGVPEDKNAKERLTSTDITRICLMLRQSDPQMCAAIKEGLGSLSERDRFYLKIALKRFYYYAPDMMSKAVADLTVPQKLDNDHQEMKVYKTQYVERVKFAATLLARIESEVQRQFQLPLNVTLNVSAVGNALAQAVTTADGLTALEKRSININKSEELVTIGS